MIVYLVVITTIESVSYFAEKTMEEAGKRLLMEISEIFWEGNPITSIVDLENSIEVGECPDLVSYDVFKIAPDEDCELIVVKVTDELADFTCNTSL